MRGSDSTGTVDPGGVVDAGGGEGAGGVGVAGGGSIGVRCLMDGGVAGRSNPPLARAGVGGRSNAPLGRGSGVSRSRKIRSALLVLRCEPASERGSTDGSIARIRAAVAVASD